MADGFKFTTIAHSHREVLGPYSLATIQDIAPPVEGLILDIGCGKGAVLKALGGTGIGIEHNPHFFAEAQGKNPNAEIWEQDASDCLAFLPEPPELIICLGASQAVGEDVVSKLCEILPSGGRLLFGDGYWRQKPATEYLQFLGGAESDLTNFADFSTRDSLETLARHEATHQEWDEYEDSYYSSVIEWCDGHPDDPDTPGFRSRITQWREAYRDWGRDTLGFGICLWRKP